MRLLPKGLDSILITEAGDSKKGESTLHNLSENLEEFYVRRGYSVEKEISDKKIKLKINDPSKTCFEVNIIYEGSARVNEARTGDSSFYFTYRFSASFNGPRDLSQKHRDAFIKEYSLI